jgi:hypothetical protein
MVTARRSLTPSRPGPAPTFVTNDDEAPVFFQQENGFTKAAPTFSYRRSVAMTKSVREVRRFFPTPFLPSALVLLSLLGLAFTGRYVQSQQTEHVEWLGWLVVATPGTSPDPGIHVGKRPLYDQFTRDDIEVGLREDGVVVWRRSTKAGKQ